MEVVDVESLGSYLSQSRNGNTLFLQSHPRITRRMLMFRMFMGEKVGDTYVCKDTLRRQYPLPPGHPNSHISEASLPTVSKLRYFSVLSP